MLCLFGFVANYLIVIILNIAGLPGALMAGKPGVRTKRQFIFGSMISALGQSYIYLGYVAFVAGWTSQAAGRDDVAGFVIWPFAFLAVTLPVWFNLIRARAEASELPYGSPQSEALHLTFLFALVAFFVFSFAPIVMRAAWAWVPFVSKVL